MHLVDIEERRDSWKALSEKMDRDMLEIFKEFDWCPITEASFRGRME